MMGKTTTATTCIALLVVFLTKYGSGLDEYKDGKFKRTYSSLTAGPRDIPRDVSEIHLDHNRISGLDDYSFVNATLCVKLDLSQNVILTINKKAFAGLSSLTYLSLNNNKITRLESDVFLPLSLCTYLGIENNPLSTIAQGAFNGLGFLHTLSLYRTKLAGLNAHMFQGLVNLEILDLGNGGTIQSIVDGTFAGLNAVTDLGLQGHNVTAITSGTFRGLTALRTLRLQDNHISSIADGAFWDSSSLQSIWLHDNQLSELRYGMFKDLYALRRIWLSGNPLHTIGAEVFADQPRPLQLTLGGTPLQCDQRLCWLKHEEGQGLITYHFPENKPNCTWNSLDCSHNEHKTRSNSSGTDYSQHEENVGSGRWWSTTLIAISAGVAFLCLSVLLFCYIWRRTNSFSKLLSNSSDSIVDLDDTGTNQSSSTLDLIT